MKSPPAKELKLLANLGGATVITSKPEKEKKLIVLVDENECGNPEDLSDKFPHLHAVLSCKWLLDSIGHYSLQDYEEYEL